MLNGLRQKAIVKPGGVVEICSPELPAGATVEVIVLLDPPPKHSEKLLTSFIAFPNHIRHSPLLACGEGVGGGVLVPHSTENRFIGSARGSFATPEEADNFIRQVRDAWEF